MEKLEMAALSKVADLLSDNDSSPIIPEEDIWEKNFMNRNKWITKRRKLVW